MHPSTSSAAGTAAPTILLTGATGNIGAELTKLLVAQGVPFRAMVRTLASQPARALRALPGVEVVTGDFNNDASLGAALVGMDRAFLLTPSSAQAEAQQLAFVAQAWQAGVRHLVKQSQWAAAVDSPVRFLHYHAAVEAAIRASGLAYTFLRPNLFMQGFLAFKDAIKEQGKFFAPIGDARISVVDVRDIAAAAAAALTASGHENKTYDLTGPAALTHAEMAAEFSAALGRAVEFVDVTPDDLYQFLLKAAMDPWMAQGLVEDYAHYQRGEAAEVSAGVEAATGRAPHNFAAFARDYAAVFR